MSPMVTPPSQIQEYLSTAEQLSEPPDSRHVSVASAPRPQRVLLVEDQSLVRAGMKTMLQMVDPGLHITEVATYDAALQAFQQYSFDLVLLDIDLRAEKSGLDLLAHVRDLAIPVKVIMLSASDDRDTVLKCIASGASGYIAKNSDDESVLAAALSSVLSDGVFLPASILSMEWPGVSRDLYKSPKTLADFSLSPRMIEVLFYVCQGLPNKAIARNMGISEGTVRKTYVSELLRHFKVTRRTELIIEVSRLGLSVPRPQPTPAASGPHTLTTE